MAKLTILLNYSRQFSYHVNAADSLLISSRGVCKSLDLFLKVGPSVLIGDIILKV